MNASVPSAPGSDQRPGGPPRPPSRDDVARRAEPLRPGGRRKADLLRLETDHGPVVVKDFAAKSPWRRLLGRLQVRRELRAYRAAGPLPGVPRLVGRVDAHALAIEAVDGVLLAKAETRFARAEAYLAQLRAILDRLHERGVVHLDLRGKSNVLLTGDDRLVLVDLAASLTFRPGGLGHRLFFRKLAIADETGLLKWKARLAPDLLTPREARLLNRFRLVRRLWVFNRKHPLPAPARPGGSGIASRLPRPPSGDRTRER